MPTQCQKSARCHQHAPRLRGHPPSLDAVAIAHNGDRASWSGCGPANPALQHAGLGASPAATCTAPASPVAPVWLATAHLLPRLHRRQSPGAMQGARPKPDPPAAVWALAMRQPTAPALVPAVHMAVVAPPSPLVPVRRKPPQALASAGPDFPAPRSTPALTHSAAASAWLGMYCAQCESLLGRAPATPPPVPCGSTTARSHHLLAWVAGADLPPSLGAHLPMLRGFGQ